jgi:hypothetical protein
MPESASNGLSPNAQFFCWSKSRSMIAVRFSGPGAAGQHEARGRERIEREFAQNELHLAGVDVVLDQGRIDRLVEVCAVGAGH